MINIPVITVDGPSGSGKGTVSQLLAEQLGWHWLDSGALYRLLALSAANNKVKTTDVAQLTTLALNLNVKFITGHKGQAPQVLLDEQDVSLQIRTETIGKIASEISAYPAVREALLDRQRAFRQLPGLVTDGRDMGTVVFSDATVKIYLTASIEERAKRRHLQLLEQGIDVKLRALIDQLSGRDLRDQRRTVAPMRPAADAIILDTTNLSIEKVMEQVWKAVNVRI